MGNSSSALHQAVLSGDVARVRIAVQDNPKQIDDTEPTNGWTALHIAAGKGFDVIVRELLARGAAPNLVDKEGRSALHLAAGQGYETVVKDLLRKGADPLRRDQAGKMPYDIAVEKQYSTAVSLLSDAMAGRGVSTPTGSPTAWQVRGQQQQGVVAAEAGVRVRVPEFATLNIGDGPAGPAAGAYPYVPAPLSTSDDWLSQLPAPPGMSMSVPSAPPAPPAAPPPAAAAGGAGAAGQQRQEQQLPDYYSYIRPLPSGQTPPAAAPPAPGGPPATAAGGYMPAYPAVPSAARPAVVAAAPAATPSSPPLQGPGGPAAQQQQSWPPAGPPLQQHQQQGWPPAAIAPPGVQQQQQQQQQERQGWPPGSSAPAAGGDADGDDDDGGWGAQDDDDWGGDEGRSSAGPGPAANCAVGDQGRSSRPGVPVDINAAVGAASKVVGAVANTAVVGAKNFLTGLIPKPPGKGGGRDSPGPDSPGGSPTRLYTMPGATTTAGPVGRLYSYDELARATQGFSNSNKLGAGGYGPVYRGVLDGVPIAVKLLDPSGLSMQGPKEFQAEVAILSRLHHPHIVLLIGSCPPRCALVYELMDYGSLEQHLFSPAFPDLAWQDRIRIACEVVSALVFLHSSPEPIVHMDLKPGNLLLNKSLVCKVSDVGLSRFMPGAAGRGQLAADEGAGGPHVPPASTVLDSRLVGTPSYMDPEYLRTGRFGPKSDTYSLGVILLQMLTGLEATRVVAVVEAALARSQADAASFATVIDSRSGSWPITEAASFAHLAMRCVELARANRPDLRSEVLPALLQLAERARLYDSSRAVKRCTSINTGQPPSMFVCPITQDVMEDPVFAADGYTYEREAIAGWVSLHSTSPMTNLPLAHNNLTPNLGLRSAIREWQEKQGAR